MIITNGGVIMFEIDTKFANANISRTIRFTDKLFDELNAVSDQHNVSFNMLVLQCCHYALAHLATEGERNA